MVHLPEDFEMNKEQMSVLTRELRKHDKNVLDEINAATNWYALIKPINEVLIKASAGRDLDPEIVLKSLVLQEIYGLGADIPFEVEVADRKSFQKFLSLKYGDVVPGNETLAQCRKALEDEGLYDRTFDNFFRQLLDAEVIPEQDLLVQNEKPEIYSTEQTESEIEDSAPETVVEEPLLQEPLEKYHDDEPSTVESTSLSVDDMIKEIEDRVKRLHDKKTPEEKQKLKDAGLKFNGNGDEEKDKEVKDNGSNELVSKLSAIDESLQKIYKNIEVLNEKQGISDVSETNIDADNELKEKVSDLYGQVKEIDDKVDASEVSEEVKEEAKDISANIMDLKEKIDQKLKDAAEKTGASVENADKEDLYKKLFDSFYSQLVDADILNETSKKVTEVISEKTTEHEVKHEVVIEDKIEETAVDDKKNSDFVLEGRVEEETGKTIPVVMRPKQKEINLRDKKKYPIFNDANLTEDYELGLRFYKLGFKTSFVNLKTDSKYGNSRIGVGEYFPNTFWASVKQRSRWIAGIVFQNWKIHGWKGSFKTKYFLTRDRKTIISFFGTALSFIVFGYFLAYAVSRAMGYNFLPEIVQQKTVLWYLMMTSLLFMFVRIFHKFAFTYNWYGLRYAIMSIFRTFVDNIVNFFAIIRAVKVFRQTKDKVVWDSTEHY